MPDGITSIFLTNEQKMGSLPLRILTYTNLFPNCLRPNFGIFVKNRMKTFVRHGNAQLDVISPVPYFPRLPWNTRWKVFSLIPREENQEGISVYHPRYLVSPKFGMRTHGYMMYRSTRDLAHRLHETNPYHLVDAHWIYPDGFAAVKIAKELGLPVVLSARGNDINEYIDYPAIRHSITWSLASCDHIISVCEALKDLILSLGIPDSKVTVIGNGIDKSAFYPTEKATARQQLALPLNKRIVLSVGILDPRKGHDILIKALHLLRQRGVEIPFLYIIGAGRFGESLKGLIDTLRLREHVYLVGEIPHKALNMWYSAADVFCLASDREGWPNVLLEAIGCGTPVVVSRVFGAPEIVTSGDVGLLVDERTPEAFAARILQAFDQKWELKKLVEFAEQFSWDKAALAVRKVFLNVLNCPNDSAIWKTKDENYSLCSF